MCSVQQVQRHCWCFRRPPGSARESRSHRFERMPLHELCVLTTPECPKHGRLKAVVTTLASSVCYYASTRRRVNKLATSP